MFFGIAAVASLFVIALIIVAAVLAKVTRKMKEENKFVELEEDRFIELGEPDKICEDGELVEERIVKQAETISITTNFQGKA